MHFLSHLVPLVHGIGTFTFSIAISMSFVRLHFLAKKTRNSRINHIMNITNVVWIVILLGNLRNIDSKSILIGFFRQYVEGKSVYPPSVKRFQSMKFRNIK